MNDAHHRPLTAVILTYNEEKHIARCIESISSLCDRIVVVDSFSTDGTCRIAQGLGAEVHQRKWPNKYSEQFNWGIDVAKATTPWMLRMDADEWLTPELCEELREALREARNDVVGLVVPRLVIFQGKEIRWGGFYPQWLLRVWRTGKGRCEERLMDEHMVVEGGTTLRLRNNLVDENLNSIHWWTSKHNDYARREAADLICLKHRLIETTHGKALGQAGNVQASSKRWIKENVYSHLPPGFRALGYFGYRFFLQGGFLDHPRVWTFHALQAAWYRTLVDVNIGEFEREAGGSTREEKVRYLRERWNIRLDRSE